MSDTSDWADQTEQQVLDHAIHLAPQTGWTRVLVRRAGAAAGLSEPEAELLLPNGPQDLAALLWRRHDAVVLAELGLLDPQLLKIRERIRVAVQARVDAAAADEAAVRRCLGFLALPQNLGLNARLTWASADAIWRWAGDAATDENHYSKRAILSGLLASTLAVRLAGGADAAALHLERGIEGVMTFEKTKARFKRGDWAASLAARLGALRYGREPVPGDTAGDDGAAPLQLP
jgi:ubiquinone biosynthesis protein COQ9